MFKKKPEILRIYYVRDKERDQDKAPSPVSDGCGKDTEPFTSTGTCLDM